MKKFLKTLNTILEQDEELPPADVPTAPEPTEELTPEPGVETLSPESEVLLVRLIKKALVTKIEPSDVEALADFSDINEVNAKESLQKLINMMKKYSQDIDVTT